MSDKQLLKRLASLSPEQRELLLKQLQKKKSKQAQPKVWAIKAYDRESDRLPMSYAQQRLWFLDQFQSGSASYNISAALKLRGNLDVEALRLAFEEIVNRHESLRTTFVTEDGQGKQVINESQRWELPTISLEPLSEEEQDEVIQTRFQGDAQTSFDLINGPLLRTRLIRLASDRHILIVTMHHIVADGWSMGVLIKEVATLYEAYSDDRTSPLPDLKIQYADYAHWQREWLAGERLDTQLNYWKQRLENTPVLELPTDYSRPPVQSFAGSNIQFELAPDLSAKLNELAKGQGVTLFMVLMATLKVLLHRYSGQDDICVGTPIANRVRPELEPLIGCFVNTLAVRSDLSNNISFTSLLKQVQQELTGAYDHQEIPFERLVDELGVAREMSHTPLFQVMFVLQNAAQTSSLKLPGLDIELLPEESKTSKFDITVNLREEQGAIKGDWEFSTDLFKPATIERMMGQFTNLLAAIVNDPSTGIDELNLLSAQDRDQLLNSLNETSADYERDDCIIKRFDEAVAAFPDSTALEFQETKLSYVELNSLANQIGVALVEKGIKPEQRVGICADRSIEMVAGILGILKAGAAFVPLDPAYPQDRLLYMLEDTDADLVLVHRHLRERLPIADNQALELDQFEPSSAVVENLNIYVSPKSPAYVMYTSGSTGKPKGIEVIQRNVVRLVRNTNFMTLDENVVFLQYAPISFDAATLEIWGSLLNGGALVVCPPGQLSAEELGAVIQRHQVNAAWLTAALFHYIAEYHIESLAGVRQLLAGGDVLSPALCKKVLSTYSDTVLINGYGPTENTTFTCCYPMHSVEDVRQTVPIGKPIANTKIYILDKQLNPVPLGVPGELYTSGDGVSNGYLNRDELTRDVFVANPFNDGDDPVMYKTGDLVRYYDDGNVEYIGRIDQQVKIRGYRIELGEIEEALGRINAVRSVAVIAREDVPGVKRLVAYIIPHDNESVVTHELKTELKNSLPDYMIPSAFVAMESFPVTANGKLDRKALPKPDVESEESGEKVAPRNEKEQALADIWQQVLNIESVGVYDNFFELGGDSILSIQITSRAKIAGLHLTTKQIFENQTIAELAEVASEVEAPILAEQGLVIGDLPLSPIEHWFFEHDFKDAHHWNQSVLLNIQDGVTLSNAKIGEALSLVIVQHDALRLRFESEEEGIRQFHHDDPDGYSHFALHEINLKNKPAHSIEDEISAQATGIQSSLNLQKGPIVTAAIFELPENQRKLLLAIHHLVVDGISWRVLLDDFCTALDALANKNSPKFQPKTTSYKQWVEALQTHVVEGELDKEVDYWKGVISKGKDNLPVDHPEGDNQVALTDKQTVVVDAAKTIELLRDVPKAYKTEINDILLTALAKTITNWSGRSELLIDLEGHGREVFNERVDLSRTVGWFTSVYPVRLKYDSALPIDVNVKGIKENLRTIPNRGFGYGALKYLSDNEEVKAAFAQAPKADVVFNYLGQFDSILDNNAWFSLATEDKGSEHSLESHEPHLLSVNSHVVSGSLHVEWIYSADIFDAGTIEYLANQYVENLKQIIDYCLDPTTFGYTPSDFPLANLQQPEIDQLFGKDPNVEAVYPLSPMQEGMLFHSLFDTSSGVYFEQLSVDVVGDIQRETLYQAWNHVVNRHPVLRSAFLWDELDKPLQMVSSRIEAEVSEFDWSDLHEDEEQHRLQLWLEQDRQRGFDFAKPGLTRLAWIDLPNNRARLVWSFHHVVLDGWSLPLVMGEAFQSYAALAQDQQPQLASPGKYEDFIAWLSDFDKADALQFWKNYLHGFQAPTPLGCKKQPKPDAAKLYFEKEIFLSEDHTTQLQQFARDNHITLNTVIQAGWGILMARYSGEEDIVFGTTVSGRPADLTGVENIVGLFINTLPLRIQITEDTQIVSLLQSMQEEQLDLRRFEATPLVDIHHHSEVPGDQSLFDSILVFENYPVGDAVREGDQLLDISQVTSIEHTNYPLTLIVEPNETIRLKLSYDSTLFDETAVVSMLNHLEVILKSALSQPDVPVKRFELLDREEQDKILIEWNPEPANYPRDKCLHELFEQQAAQRPDQIALQFGQESVSYEDLNKRANQLARILIAKGVKDQSFVAIALDRSIDMIVSILATLKAGGAYVPLDPSYPEERLTFMLEDTKAPVMVTKSQHADIVLPIAEKAGEVVPVLLDRDQDYIAEQFDTNLDQPIFGDANRLAYVVYTSGSTGKPKGVVCTQLAVNRLVIDANYITFTAEDKVAHLSNVSFDASTFEIWGALLNGGSLVIIDKELLLTPEDFVAEAERTGINVMFITTALFNAFAINHPHFFEQLDYLLFGGEACDPQQVRKIARNHKPKHFLHVYGPSENTTYSTWFEIEDVPEGAITVPIGRSLSGSTAYILDKHLQPVPVGVTGEIYVGGDGLATEYLNDPDKTSQAFIEGALVGESDRLYKTGDLARFTDDGQIEILGRADDQVKVRGFRIELGEVEASLTRIDAVREAVVIVREDEPGQKRLVAYVQVDVTMDSGEVRRESTKVLPKHMVPSTFVVMDEFPLNQNGKVDKRKLPEPTAEASQSTEYLAPRNAKESILVDIWQQVLKADTIGVYDNFFELGGDSILSIQIISRAKRAGLHITAKQVFEFQTIADLAEVATDLKDIVKAEQGLVEGEALLTPVQQWFFNQQLADIHHFNQSVVFKLDAGITQAHLKEAWEGVLYQHDALRLLFHKENSSHIPAKQWHQTFRQSEHIEALLDQVFEVVDLSTLPESAQTEQLETLADQFQTEINLEKGPLIKVVIFNLGEAKASRMLVVIHHLVVDVFSWRVIVEDLQTALTQCAEGKSVELGAKTTSFKQWAEALEEFSNSNALEEDYDYWKSLLELATVDLPKDNNGSNTISSVEVVETALSAEQTQALLTKAPSCYRTEINELLLSALALTLSEWTEHENALVDLEGHGREHIADSIDISRTVGWFTSIFPLILQVKEGGLGEVIKSVKEQMRAVPMKGMSFGLLRYMHQDKEVRERLAGIPTAHISFNYLGQLDKVVDADALIQQAEEKPGSEISPACERDYALEVSGRVQGGQLQLAWRYSTALHHEKTIRQLSDAFLNHLNNVIEHCVNPDNAGYTPSDFPLANLEQAQVDELFVGKDGIEAVYPLSPVQEGMLFHSLYEPGSWVYFDQVSVDLGGNVSEANLFKAWEAVVSRHSILRTGFVWEGVAQPLQVVYENIELPIARYDWSQFSEEEAQEKLERFMIDDRNFGFNFRNAGVLRLTWIKLPSQRYQLIWSFHHILLDGWSMPVVFKELFACYEQLNQLGEVQLPSAPRYQDFIGWLLSRDKQAEDDFWSRYLAGFSAPTPIPLRNSQAIVSQKEKAGDSAARYCESEILVSGELLDRLQLIAKDQRLTLNHILQGVWGALLNRYCGEDDILFGTTVSGRPADLPGIENMVGLFINTLPLRMTVQNELPFMEWLHRVQDQQVDMKHFESSSLVDVQKHSQVSSKQALFESILVFENYPIDESLEEDSQSMLDIGEIEAFQQTNFPLTLVAIPGKDLIVRFSYDSHLFEHDTIARILSHIENALLDIAEDPNVIVGDINILSEDERYKVLNEWNHTFTEFPDEKGLAQLFEEVVAKHGDLTASTYRDTKLSFSEMNAAANRLAHYLVEQESVQLGQPIATCFDRSHEMLIAILAILKAGGAYVPIDPTYPEDRVQYMLDDTKAPVLLVDQQYEDRFGYLTETKAVNYQGLSETLANCSDQNLNLTLPDGGASLGIVIYTSGSTGKPKGVLLPQKGAARMAINTNYMDVKPGDKFTHAANLSFDAATFEIWGALLNGCELVIVDKDTALSPDAFADLVKSNNVNLVFLTTALFHVLSKTVPSMFADLDYVMFGGEACDPNLVRDLVESEHKPKHVMNFYGPSENSTYATYYEIKEVIPGQTSIPIGYSVGHSTTYILDSNRRPVPFGVPGEIFVGGKGVAIGYQNRAELTANVFMDDPYCVIPNGRMYSTGDLGRIMPNGAIEILGRIDDQVKMRGYRIELGEIATALTNLEMVSDACVLVKQDQSGNKQLVAYFESSSEPDVGELRAKLKQQLPDYMVPAAYIFMERLPITPNGKIDKRALPEPAADAYQAAEYVGPRNNVEEGLVEIWQEVLSMPQVGIYDDFFELGGHSLLITKVSSRIKEKLNVELPLRTLFEVPTIAALAEIIASVMWQAKPQEESSEDEWDDEDFEEGTL
ncbi:MAG: amino acid adenylation domain-containing protein [Pseudomonadales bacterium]|nr:amino acid adenylation domain-containing protein [Pseudomonadales bacterium]